VRVLVVTSRWELVGGSERYARDVAKGLVERGLEVRVLCEQAGADAGPEVNELPRLFAPRPAPEVRAVLHAAAGGADAVLLLSHAPAALLSGLLELAPLVRFVQDHTLFCPGLNKQHEDGGLCTAALGSECLRRYWLGGGCSGMKIDGRPSLRRPLRALRERLREIELSRRARRVVVASDYMRGELARCGFAPERLEVLPYFTRAATSLAPRASLAPATAGFVEAGDGPLLLCPARLVLPDKGVDYLLTALAKARRDLRLIVAGDGPARPWLEAKARAEGLAPRVHFTGWLDAARLETLYERADLVVCPSVWNEPFGLVGIEAMAHGRPVVAFDAGGIGEWLVDGVTGRLCPRRDADALARALDELAGDPVARERLGARGRERVERRYRPAAHLDRLVEVMACP